MTLAVVLTCVALTVAVNTFYVLTGYCAFSVTLAHFLPTLPSLSVSCVLQALCILACGHAHLCVHVEVRGQHLVSSSLSLSPHLSSGDSVSPEPGVHHFG